MVWGSGTQAGTLWRRGGELLGRGGPASLDHQRVRASPGSLHPQLPLPPFPQEDRALCSPRGMGRSESVGSPQGKKAEKTWVVREAERSRVSGPPWMFEEKRVGWGVWLWAAQCEPCRSILPGMF